jgi:alkylation response protein AidB-like acyl-CoA dehydrogenase
VVAPRARKTDREELFPAEVYRQMGELGQLGVNVPVELGGAGAGVISYSLAVLEIAAACAATSVGMCVTNMVAEAASGSKTPKEAAERAQKRAERYYKV